MPLGLRIASLGGEQLRAGLPLGAVHYQDTDSSDYPCDYLTAWNYDNDRISTNNWDNRGNGLWPATVHYSVVERCTHWFITYAFYHPRDWSDTVFDQEHENDLEGVILSVRKDGSAYGRLEGMITVFHTDFFSYTPPGSPYTGGHETIDGTIPIQTAADGFARVKTVAQAKGHGVKARPYTSDFNGAAKRPQTAVPAAAGAGLPACDPVGLRSPAAAASRGRSAGCQGRPHRSPG